MIWNALLACVDPISPRGIVGAPPNPPVTSPTGPELPIAPTLTVEPLVAGAATAIEVQGAGPSASVTVWRGTFGGSSCPSELGGYCLPVGGAEVATTGTADAAGALATTWAVPASEPDGSYVVLVATADAATSTLPVMRRVWVGAPDFADRDLLDVFDLTHELTDDGEALPTVVPAGDWMDLSLDGGDEFSVFARGNELLEVDATFHLGLMDVLPFLYEPDASEDALEHWLVEEHPDTAQVSFEGRSLATGAWTVQLAADYGSDRGLYDLSVRLTAPEEPSTWYADLDGDGWGDVSTPTEAPVAPDAAVYRADDCDDGTADTNPDAWDVCEDSVDQDCSGADKVCRGAPDADGEVSTFSGLHAYVGMGIADLGMLGDVDGDGLPEAWARNTNYDLHVIEGEPGDDFTAIRWTQTAKMGATRAGDFDHDGVRDIAFGETDVEPEGAVLLVRTPTDPDALRGSAWATLLGSVAEGSAGEMLEVGGDVDGDGWDDLVVGAPDDGAIWLVTSAPPGRATLDAVATAKLEGTDLGRPGTVSISEDFDGDGLADLVLGGNYGPVSIFHGPLAGTVDPVLDADAMITVPDTLERVLPTGDTDGDGVGELLLTTNDGHSPGNTWLFEAPIGPVDAAGAASVVTTPGVAGGVAAIADLDGDGADDVVLGERGEDHRGRVEILYGPVPAAAELPTDADVVLVSRGEDEITANGLWSGDFDGDGGDDVAIIAVLWEVPPDVFGWDFTGVDVLFGTP